MDRRIFALGETVLDIIFDGEQPSHAFPGGSMLNAAVSLGRAGAKVEFISEFGYDQPGDIIASFLNRNNVGTSYCYRYPANLTSLALAFLDAEKKASYRFYHDAPPLLPERMIPDFTKQDFLIFGSFYAIKPERRAFVLQVLQAAHTAGCIILYDPNIRKAHPVDSLELRKAVLENLSLATIVKGSDEDFLNLFNTNDPAEVREKTGKYCRVLLMTRGSEGVWLTTPAGESDFRVPPIEPVSTIGAGDNFSAGIAYGLLKYSLHSQDIFTLDQVKWSLIVDTAISFATATCLSSENYIPVDFGQQLQSSATNRLSINKNHNA